MTRPPSTWSWRPTSSTCSATTTTPPSTAPPGSVCRSAPNSPAHAGSTSRWSRPPRAPWRSTSTRTGWLRSGEPVWPPSTSGWAAFRRWRRHPSSATSTSSCSAARPTGGRLAWPRWRPSSGRTSVTCACSRSLDRCRRGPRAWCSATTSTVCWPAAASCSTSIVARSGPATSSGPAWWRRWRTVAASSPSRSRVSNRSSRGSTSSPPTTSRVRSPSCSPASDR